MTDHAILLPRYLRLRQIGLALNHKLVATLSTEVLHEGARRLGILQGSTFVFDSEDETSVLMDYCIYNVRSGGKNAVERYLATSPPPADSDEMMLLEAKQSAYYSIVKITGMERGVGVSVDDVLRGETGFLFDVGFSKSAKVGLLIAGRVIPCGDFLMTGGASLPLSSAARNRGMEWLQRLGHQTDTARLAPEQEADLAALTIRACLKSGASSAIEYKTPGQGTSRRRPGIEAQSPIRANRNDPCPCGSGRKYKSCCRHRSAHAAGFR
jgi:hypothetical protein